MIQQFTQQAQIPPQESINEQNLTQAEIETQILYRNWRKNAPYLYNTIYTQCTTWPSLTAQWLPELQIYKNQGYSINRVIYATNTSNQQQDYVIVSKVKLPFFNENKKIDSDEQDEEPVHSIGLMADKKQDKVQVYSMIQHEGQVNRARYNPFKTNIIATKSTNGNIYVFNYIQHSKDGKSQANSTKLQLIGHDDEGFGLSWSQTTQGILASGANDGKVLTWDLNKISEKSKEGVSFVQNFVGHQCPVNDVAWHKSWPNILASADDDGEILFWDSRQGTKLKRKSYIENSEIYSIDFSKTNQYSYVSGGSDQLVYVWDLRMFEPYLKLDGHTKAITKVQYSAKDKNIIWSSSSDRTVRMWDLSVPEPGSMGDEEQGKQQQIFNKHCRFIHGGHRDVVSDFSIHPQDDNKLFSVDEGNQLHVFDPVY